MLSKSKRPADKAMAKRYRAMGATGMASSLIRFKRPDLALKQLSAALKLDPKLAVAHLLAGEILARSRKAKRIARARDHLNKALQYAPKDQPGIKKRAKKMLNLLGPAPAPEGKKAPGPARKPRPR
jgi:tetratricopeptide (TPR) repeat protein